MPQQEELYGFIAQNCQADHVTVTMQDVMSTLRIAQGKQPEPTPNWDGKKTAAMVNPHVIGHFDAFNFIFQQLLPTGDFPCKDANILVNEYHSRNALWWFRELHVKLMYPVAHWGTNNGDPHAPKTYQCGVYRSVPRTLAFARAPEPEQIEPLLHHWLRDISIFNDEIKGKIHNPYSLSRTEAEQLYAKPLESALFLSCLQPFDDNGNNRFARLVENALRLKWNMPWKHVQSDESYLERLGRYQTEGMATWYRRLLRA